MVIEVRKGSRIFRLRQERPCCWQGWLCDESGKEIVRGGHVVAVIDQPNQQRALRALQFAATFAGRKRVTAT